MQADKKKKKKGKARSAKPAEDIDAILAEIDGLAPTPVSVDPVPQVPAESMQPTMEGSSTKDVELTAELEEAATGNVVPEVQIPEQEENDQDAPKVLQ